MKKILCLMLAVALLVPMTGWAQDTNDDEGMSSMMMEGMPPMMGERNAEEKPPMMGMQGMKGMKGGCPMMMGKPQMQVTNAGDVIVLNGNKLIKYDGDLNLIKEVDIPMPKMGKPGKKPEEQSQGSESAPAENEGAFPHTQEA